jgi:hypothetical protein
MVWFVVALFGMACWLRRQTPPAWPFIAACFTLAFILIFAAQMAPRWYPLQANRFSPTLNFLLAVPVAYAITATLDRLKALFARSLPVVRLRVVGLAPYLLCVLLLLPVLYFYRASRSKNAHFIFDLQARMAFYPDVQGRAALPDAQVLEGAATPTNLSTTMEGNKLTAIQPEALLEAFKQEHKDDAALAETAAMTLNGILRFAQEHKDGRYLVELPNLYTTDIASFDSHALNSYLGAQGNETLTVIFREASPNALFMYPQVNALSYNPDNFGFSSVLGDDLDFSEQPLARHLERARFLGTKYLVVNSAKLKDKLAAEPNIARRYNFGAWSIFELRVEPPPPVRVLPYRPALLVTDFTVKGRYGNESNYIRFAEEQFFDGWFDVLLVRAPSTKLDDLGSLSELKQFGGLILDSYDCDSCDLVYRQLQNFAQSRPLILLASDNVLFNRIRNSIDDFPLAKVIERPPQGKGTWLDNLGPTQRYRESSIRQQWAEIRSVLEQHEFPTEPCEVDGVIKQNSIQVNYHAAADVAPAPAAPVLISTSYHPNWQRRDGDTVYAANPMFMLVFVQQPTALNFARRPVDRFGLWAATATLLGLLCFTGWSYRHSFKSFKGRKPARS